MSVDVFLYAGLTPASDVELSDPTTMRQAAGEVPARSARPLAAVLDAWNLAEVRSWRALTLAQAFLAPVDTPPGVSPAWLSIVRAAWEPAAPSAQRSARTVGAPGWSTDSPPAGFRQANWRSVLQWQARPLTPIIVGFLVPDEVPGDNPPFGIPPDWLSIVRARWEPDPPMAQWTKRTVAPAIWPVESPVPGYPPVGRWMRIRSAWDLDPPAPQRSKPAAAVPGWSVNVPPTLVAQNALTRLRWIWEPKVWRPPSTALLAQPLLFLGVDTPPFGIPPGWLWVVLGAWEPGPPAAQGDRRSIAAAYWPNDSPSPGSRPFVQWRTIRGQWEPGPPMVPVDRWRLIFTPGGVPPEAAHLTVPASGRVYLLVPEPNAAGPAGPLDVPGWERRYVFPAEPEAEQP